MLGSPILYLKGMRTILFQLWLLLLARLPTLYDQGTIGSTTQVSMREAKACGAKTSAVTAFKNQDSSGFGGLDSGGELLK